MSPREAIVCVDDEPLVLKALRRSLRRRLGERFSIEAASNGAEALQLIDELSEAETAIRLVISDATMPVMDGYELLHWLHEHKPGIFTILVTGNSDPDKVGRLSESGLVAAFDKPWNSEELCSVIEQKLGGHPA